MAKAKKKVDTREAQLILLEKQVNVRLPKGLLTALVAAAKGKKVTLSAFIRQALAETVKWRG